MTHKRESLITTEEKLLFDILQELKEINQKLTAPAIPEPVCPTREGIEDTVEKKKFYRKCRKCGDEFDNYGNFMGHMKEHKQKEGA